MHIFLNRLSLFIFLSVSFTYAGGVRAETKDNAALVAKGQRQFLKCASCHEIVDSNVVKSGPRLKGVFGRKVASLEDYPYSASLKSLSFSWDEAQLDRWLEQPTAVAAGTTMAFIGLPKPDDRKALIAYLKSAK